MRDHRAPETTTRTDSAFTPLASLSRASLAGALLALFPAGVSNHDAPPRGDGAPEVRVVDVSYGTAQSRADAIALADVPANASIIGKTLRVPGEREGMPDMIVRIENGPGGIAVEVDGKSYGIDDSPLLPNVTLATVIDDALLANETVTLVSKEYGTANVKLADVKTDLRQLSSSERATVDASVPAEFEAKEGTLLARSLGLARAADDARKNLFAWMGGGERETPATPSYGLTFRRKNPNALAMANGLTKP